MDFPLFYFILLCMLSCTITKCAISYLTEVLISEKRIPHDSITPTGSNDLNNDTTTSTPLGLL